MGLDGQLELELAVAQDLDRVLQVAHEAARRAAASGVTSVPASKRRASSRRLTPWVCVRNGPIGIDIFLCEPRSLPMLHGERIWPPSKPARMHVEPERDFWPF